MGCCSSTQITSTRHVSAPRPVASTLRRASVSRPAVHDIPIRGKSRKAHAKATLRAVEKQKSRPQEPILPRKASVRHGSRQTEVSIGGTKTVGHSRNDFSTESSKRKHREFKAREKAKRPRSEEAVEFLTMLSKNVKDPQARDDKLELKKATRKQQVEGQSFLKKAEKEHGASMSVMAAQRAYAKTKGINTVDAKNRDPNVRGICKTR